MIRLIVVTIAALVLAAAVYLMSTAVMDDLTGVMGG